jgi:hypothetical protein
MVGAMADSSPQAESSSAPPDGIERGGHDESITDRASYARAMHHRQTVRRSIVILIIVGLLVAVGLVGVPVMRQITTHWSLRAAGFAVDWQLDSENWRDGGVTGVSYRQHYWTNTLQSADADLLLLSKLWNVESLNLGECYATEKGLAPLASLRQLKELSLLRLGHMRYGGGAPGLSDACLVPIKGLTNLQSLTLAGNRITDSGLDMLSGLSSLETLDLDATDVTDAGLHHLYPLKGLKTLSLAGTSVTPEGIKTLLAAVPGLEVDLGMDPQLADQVRIWRRQNSGAPKSRPPGSQ